MKKKTFLSLVFALVLSLSICLTNSYAAELSSFNPEEYVTGEVDEVNIYLGLSFGMTPEECMNAARVNGYELTRNTYDKGYTLENEKVSIEGFANTDARYYINNEETSLIEVMFIIYADNSYDALEKTLTLKYGDTPYCTSTGKKIPNITNSKDKTFNPIGSDEADIYSQRVLRQSNGKYVIIDHYADPVLAGWLLQRLVITEVAPK